MFVLQGSVPLLTDVTPDATDTGFWILVTGFWILDTESRVILSHPASCIPYLASLISHPTCYERVDSINTIGIKGEEDPVYCALWSREGVNDGCAF